MSYSNSPVETSERGSVGSTVFILDQTTPVLTVPFLQERAAVTLAAPTSIGDRTIVLQAGHSVTAGEVIELAQVGSNVFMQSAVLDVSVNTITLDQPVNAVYATTDTAIASTQNMNVDGSVTPQIFSVLPGPTQSGDMVRMIVEMRGTADMNFSTFGSIASLTNGCVLRVKKADGTFRNLFNFKNCGDIIEQAYDHSFFPNNGGGVRGFTSRLTWGGPGKHGVVIRLDGALGEELQLVIQDDLSAAAMQRFHVTCQGHELQGL